MRGFIVGVVVAFLLCALCSTVYGAEEDKSGLTAWGSVGEELQEGRVGYFYAPWALEPFVGAVHEDTPEGEQDEWGARAGLLFHAITADMLAQFWKIEAKLPDGALYAGPFAQYSHDRENEWSGGYVVGGLVDIGNGWDAVAEYQSTIWNATDQEYIFVAGLRRLF